MVDPRVSRIQKALHALAGDVEPVVITHRPSAMARVSEYVVLEWNQASGRPAMYTGEVYDDEDEALLVAREALANNRADGRREGYLVHELGELVWQDEDDEGAGVLHG